MNEPLFFRPEETLQKTAGEVDLPEDPNMWPQEILQELYKQVPYIADYQPHIQMQRVDAEQGYGVGHVEIKNQTEAPSDAGEEAQQAAGIRSIRIPFVIKSKKLSPFDLLVNDMGKVIPLTENRLRQALFRPQAFDVTSRTPGDQSMIGQLYPPYRQNYGFGGGGVAINAGGGMGKSGAALGAFIDGAEEKDEKTAAEYYMTPEGGVVRSDRFGVGEVGGAVTGGLGGALLGGAVGGALGAPVLGAAAGGIGGLALGSSAGKGLETAVRGAPAPKGSVKMNPRAGRLAWQQQKTSSVLDAVLPTIGPEDHESFVEEVDKNAAALVKNAGVLTPILSKVVEQTPVVYKLASWTQYTPPTVSQIQKRDDGYAVKYASHLIWEPIETVVDRGEIVGTFGTKLAMDVDTAGAVTAVDAPPVGEEASLDLEPVEEPGLYKVKDVAGKELVGIVIPSLIDIDGKAIPISLFTNGSSVAVQSDIQGELAGDGFNLPSGPVGEHGLFFKMNNDGLAATVPFQFSDSFAEQAEPTVFNGTTFDGRPVEVSVQPNLAEPTPTGDGRILIPDDWEWLPLDGTEATSLMGDEEDKARAEEEQKVSHVVLRTDGDVFSVSGLPVEKLGYAQTNFLDVDDAMFLLGGLGVPPQICIEKMGEAYSGEAVKVKVGREISLMDDLVKQAMTNTEELLAAVPGIKPAHMVKEAVEFPDPTTVDTVLSLGFINSENAMTFVSYLPDIDDAQTKLCEILLATRLGLQNVNASSVERAIRSVEETIEGLKILAFQGN